MKKAKKFIIRYLCLETGEEKETTAEFEDYEGRPDHNGQSLNPVKISAEDWASDLGYSLSDKGWYEIEEIK